MVEKRYYQRDFEELYYIIDSNVIPEKEFDEKEMYDGYTAFEDSMTGEEIVDLLNKQHEQIEDLKDANVRCCNEYSYFHKRMIQVEKENEWLKKELKRCRDWLNSDKNDYQLTLAFIKSKGYSLKDVLEYEKELLE